MKGRGGGLLADLAVVVAGLDGDIGPPRACEVVPTKGSNRTLTPRPEADVPPSTEALCRHIHRFRVMFPEPQAAPLGPVPRWHDEGRGDVDVEA